VRRNRQPLSDHVVSRLKPGESTIRLWDALVPGFGIQVTPKKVKSWVIQFDRNGRTATIGGFPSWNTESARSRARELRQLHDNGRDIRAFLHEQKESKDLGCLVDIWREEYAPSLKPSTLKSYESILKNTILPKLKDRLVKDLSYEDIKSFYRQVRKTTPIQANRAVAILSKLFSIAEKEGWRTDGSNPCRKIEKSPERPKNRILSIIELEAIEIALVELVDEERLDPAVADLVRFLALSGLRRGEAIALQWKDIDLNLGVITFEDHKTDYMGVKLLPLNPPLRDILKRRASQKISPFVFPGRILNRPFNGLGKCWERVLKQANITNLTPHDLRRTFHTACIELGFTHGIGDALLGHSLGRIRDTYTSLNPRGIISHASDEVSAWLLAAMHGKNPVLGVSERSKDQNASKVMAQGQ